MQDDDLMVTITIEPPETSFEQLTGLSEEQTLDVIAQTLAQAGIDEPVEVGVLISTDEQLRILNRDFREIDAATDVLSFPPVFGLGNAFAGDVAISAEMAVQNARLLGHSPAEEIKILTLHGMLHLAGYDHDRDQGEMARTEERLRRSLRLPGGLIDRNREPEPPGAGSRTRSPATTMQRKSAPKRVAQSASSSLRFSTARAAGWPLRGVSFDRKRVAP
jgi:probable rRNA maturation factor